MLWLSLLYLQLFVKHSMILSCILSSPSDVAMYCCCVVLPMCSTWMCKREVRYCCSILQECPRKPARCWPCGWKICCHRWDSASQEMPLSFTAKPGQWCFMIHDDSWWWKTSKNWLGFTALVERLMQHVRPCIEIWAFWPFSPYKICSHRSQEFCNFIMWSLAVPWTFGW